MENTNFELREVKIIADTIQILLDAEEIMQNHGKQLRPSIYMTPGVFRDLSPDIFNPQVVAIGPLHRGDENLQIIEGQKVTYLHDLLRRLKSPPQEVLATCVQKVEASVKTIRSRYAGFAKLNDYSDSDLAKMMVIDSCFILEFLYRVINPSILMPRDTLGSGYIAYDLILLENQIPLFVLNDIYECTIWKFDQTYSLTELVLTLFDYVDHIGSGSLIRDVSVDTNTNHILGLLHKSYRNSFAMSSIPAQFFPTSYSAVELAKSGVYFKPNNEKQQKLAMRFKPSLFKPTLCMPVLHINESTNTIIYNLIAYEQCFPEVGDYVTQYVVAFMMLVDTQEDLMVLRESKIIVYDLSGRQYDFDMIHRICNRVTVGDKFSYNRPWQQLGRYYNSRLGWLRRTYFSGAWSFIASISALILFILTVIQTYCSVRAP